MNEKEINQVTDLDEEIQDSVDSPAETQETDIEKPIPELEAQVKANYELYLKALADLDNFKKRAQKDHEEIVHYSNANLIKKLLPVLDDFDRAIANAEQNRDFESLLKGIEMIHKNFHEILSGEGVETVKALGGEFDPQVHQPLTVEPSDQGENIVIEEFQKGYIYKNRLLRPSLVKVSQ